MPAAPIISGMMLFFTATTVAVFAYPIVRLLPSWLERSAYRRIAFHRDAIAALGTAIDRCGDTGHLARLTARRDWHRAALATLAPGEAGATPVATPRIDAAA